MKILDELLGSLWDHRSPARSEPRGHQTGVAKPPEVHVHAGRLEDFRKIIWSSLRPTGQPVFPFTPSDERPGPRMSQRCEVDFPRGNRRRLPVGWPARSVLVNDVHPKVLPVDDGAGRLQETRDELAEIVAQRQQPGVPILEAGAQLPCPPRPAPGIRLLLRPEEI